LVQIGASTAVDVSDDDDEEEETDSLVSEEAEAVPRKRARLDSLVPPPTVTVTFVVKQDGGVYDPENVLRETPREAIGGGGARNIQTPPLTVDIPVRRANELASSPRYRNQLQRNLAMCDQEGVPRGWIYTETSVDGEGKLKSGVKMFSSYVKAVEYYHAKLKDLHRVGKAGPKGLLHDGECQLQFRGFASSKRHFAEIAIRALAQVQHDPVYGG